MAISRRAVNGSNPGSDSCANPGSNRHDPRAKYESEAPLNSISHTTHQHACEHGPGQSPSEGSDSGPFRG